MHGALNKCLLDIYVDLYVYICTTLRCRNGERQAVHHVLNECLVDRGASPAMVTLQVSADRHHITTVQVRSRAR
jgi:NAD+ kinase